MVRLESPPAICGGKIGQKDKASLLFVGEPKRSFFPFSNIIQLTLCWRPKAIKKKIQVKVRQFFFFNSDSFIYF